MHDHRMNQAPSQTQASSLPHAYRPDIDGLRAVAVLAVLVFHYFPEVLPSGFIGVDIFFVLSGFLITGIVLDDLAAGRFRLWVFYQRRIRRIFPAFLLVLGTCLAVGWALLLADEYAQLGRHTVAGAAFAANLALWQESGYFDNAADTKVLLHLWSLGIEEQFYLVWPLALAWVMRKRWTAKAIAIGLFTLLVASFAWNLRDLSADVTAAYYSPLGRAWELLIGAALAWASRQVFWTKWLVRLSPDYSACFGAILLLAALIWITPRSAFPGWWAFLPTVGVALVLMAGPRAWLNRQVLSSRPMVAVGLISYPLYLWHWPLLVFPRLVLSETPNPASRLGLMGLTFLLAWATYLWVEKPVRASAVSQRGPRILAGLVAGMVILGSIGALIAVADGLPSRASVAAYANNRNELQRTPDQDEACRQALGSGPVVFHYCRMKNVNGAATVAVMGDSHAHVAYPGIAQFMALRGVNTLLLANSGCPPFIGAEYGEDANAKARCRRQIEAMVDTLAQRQDVHQVLMFSRGPKYYTGLGFGAIEKPEARAPYINREAYFAGMQATIDRLVQSGKHVMVVAENPELGFSPEACMPRPLREHASHCHLARADVVARQADYWQGLAGLKGARVLPVIDAFCPPDQTNLVDQGCKVVHQGQLLYADDDHLSVAGSRFQMEQVIAPALEGNGVGTTQRN
jgi:peptidoglycan/LPS O-acetylase OafA/YrhL